MLKRISDILISSFVLLLTAPIWIVLLLLIKLTSDSSPFFLQTRPGLHGRPFTIIKFCTMKDTKDAGGNLLPDAQRLTAFGSLLRKTSLDELPELINVIRGEMSLVGPRPLLMQYLPRYTPEQFRRHEIKPGITGWAQINGRNALTWEEKFRLDVWYVDHQSFFLDLKIMCITLLKLITREGISAEGHATMPEFRGSGPVQK
jgi:sugar transferase EpsL